MRKEKFLLLSLKAFLLKNLKYTLLIIGGILNIIIFTTTTLSWALFAPMNQQWKQLPIKNQSAQPLSEWGSPSKSQIRKDAENYLLRQLDNDDVSVQIDAAFVLGQNGYEKGINHLTKLAQDGWLREVFRINAIRAISILAKDTGNEKLISELKSVYNHTLNYSFRNIRHMTISAIGEIGGESIKTRIETSEILGSDHGKTLISS